MMVCGLKIKLYSDLHIEFADCDVQGDEADVVVLAGDIDVGTRGVDWILRQKFDCPVVYVLGNHEYYHHTYPELLNEIKRRAAGYRIHVLENESVTIGGVCFHGATLWTDFALIGDARLSGYTCERVVNDFALIRHNVSKSKISAADVARIHRRTLNWLSESLSASESAINVVVTHHAPSVRSVASRFRGNIVTTSFASDLEAFIFKHRPDYWLHGHLHASNDYRIGGCRVQSNARGYPNALNPAFDSALTLNISPSDADLWEEISPLRVAAQKNEGGTAEGDRGKVGK